MELRRPASCRHVYGDSFGRFDQLRRGSVSETWSEFASSVKDAQCHACRIGGTDLWLCLHSDCSRILCGVHAKDHQKEEVDHCLNLDLSALRLWCLSCNTEVYEHESEFQNSPRLLISFLESQDNLRKPKMFDSPLGIVGLQNLGNTCYMNATLQALSNIPPMTQYFLDCVPGGKKEKDGKRNTLTKAYSNLMRNMWSGDPPISIAPTSVLYAVKLVFLMFRGFQQHDSQEFLRCFMDQLHEELKEPFHQDKQTKDYLLREDSEETESEHSESESYLTCDSGLSGDEDGSQPATDVSSVASHPRKRTWSISENEFSDALDRSPSPMATESATDTTKYRSIVSDVFDGQILSCVQCLTCNLTSSRIETFQDLSLPIPSRDQLYVIHQSAPRPSNQSESQGWLYWMWSTMWTWLWGPGINLYDCLSAFFSADELKGDNMYSCEKCRKLRNGVKYSSMVQLPEVLTIHLKRFRNEPLFSSKISSHIAFPLRGLEMKPWISRECTSSVTTYDLVGVIVHHGTAGGGHYTCYALNEPAEQWVEFDDSSARPVSPETVANCQSYVLFYRKSCEEMQDFRSHVANQCRELNGRMGGGLLEFFISAKWFSKFKTFAEPGPIHNRDFLCPHGGVQPLKVDCIHDSCLPISAVMWEDLHARFGGGPACNRLRSCATCQQAQEAMDKRRKEELELFLQLQKDFQNETTSGSVCAIAMNWFRKWESFVRNRDAPLPGPVDNVPITILRNGNRVLRPSSDFAQLSPGLWQLFHQRYGGGPEILIRL